MPKDKKPKVEEVSAEDAQTKELRDTARGLAKSIESEAQDFNEYQQQREKLNYFWIVEKKDLEDKKSMLRNKERELQDLEEKHQVEIKIYKQRLKHLLHEFQNEVTLKKTGAELALKLKQDEHRGRQAELKTDRRALRVELKEKELAHEEFLKSLKQKMDRNITNLRQEFERKSSEIQRDYEEKMGKARLRLEDRRKVETTAIEQKKNEHIQSLMEMHKKAFSEIKNYYNDITHNNLDLIKSLKEEVAEMRLKESHDEKQMEHISQENKRMSEPFKKARKDVEHLRSELERYREEKEELRQTKAQLLVVEDEYRKLRWENEVAGLRFAEIKAQRDSVKEKFASAVFETQQKSGFRNMLLEKKLSSVNKSLEAKEAQLNEVLARAGMESNAAASMKGKVDDLLKSKNQEVLDLQVEIERVTVAQQQLNEAVKTKLGEYGVPIQELGFVPRGS